MAVGDRPPEWSYITGTENGCTWRSDGHLYNANGYQVETEAEKRARYEEYERERERKRKKYESNCQPSDSSHSQSANNEFQKLGSQITNKSITKGIIGAVGIGAAVAGAVTYFSETKKDPANKANAMKKAGRNALLVIGISLIIAVLCIVAVIAIVCIISFRSAIVEESIQAETEMKQLEQEFYIEQTEDQSITDKIQIDDKVIYEEEGIVVTLESFEYDSLRNSYVCSVEIENNNPDNKKVDFLQVEGITLNGIDSGFGGSYLYEVLAGESGKMDINIFAHQYESSLRMLEEETNVFPIEKIGYYYRIKVGSDSEPVKGHAILKASGYQEDNLNRVYGEQIYEFTVDETPFEVYLKQNADGECITLKNLGASDMSFQGNLNFVDINGKYNSSVWVVNGKATNYKDPYMLQTILV